MTPRSCRLVLVASAALALAALAPHQAFGHDLPATRSIVAQVGVDRLDLFVVFVEPARSARASLLISRYDLDHDGALGEHEAQLAGPAWIGEAMHGVHVEMSQDQAAPSSVRYKFDRRPDGALAMAALLSFDLPALPSDQKRPMRLFLEKGAHVAPCRASARAQGAIAIAGARARSTAPRVLSPGEELRTMFVHPE